MPNTLRQKQTVPVFYILPEQPVVSTVENLTADI